MSYRGKEVVVTPDGKDPPPPPQPCKWCQKITAHAALVNYGGRCFACFETYCNEPQPKARTDRNTGPRAWAHILKASEEAGAPMTQATRHAWRNALGVRVDA